MLGSGNIFDSGAGIPQRNEPRKSEPPRELLISDSYPAFAEERRQHNHDKNQGHRAETFTHETYDIKGR